MHHAPRRGRRLAGACATLLAAGTLTAFTTSATAAPAHTTNACPPSARAVSYSDALDKLSAYGAEVGGLSSLAYDARSHSYVAAVDNHLDDPSRIWFFTDLDDPTVTRAPLVLKKPDGTPYTGLTADNEGLAVLKNGDFLVSSETEPSIRVFGRDGVQKQSLPVPARFAVTGTSAAGQATNNATLEGLTLTPSKTRIVAAMEGALSGDVSATGDATAHRFLVYDLDRRGTWKLTKQIGYRTETGNRVPEVAAYGQNSFLVEEAAFSATAGNSVELYSVGGLDRAEDVSRIGNLSDAPPRDIAKKTLVADVTKCPTLGAPAKETQTNPLLDNFEGTAVTSDRRGLLGVSLVSDDNFSATQTTRILNLTVCVR